MHRFFGNITDGRVCFDENELPHIKVARIRDGECIGVITPDGEYIAEAVCVSAMDFRIAGKALNAEPKIRVTLYQAYPKSDKLEDIVKKCTELGVWRIVPFLSERCVKKPEGTSKRLNEIAKSAVKQCGRTHVPEIGEVRTFQQAVNELKDFDTVLFPYEEAQEYGLKRALDAGIQGNIAVVIGPEGGFPPNEAKEIEQAGAKTVTLGPRILRTETAGAAVLAALMCFAGEME